MDGVLAKDGPMEIIAKYFGKKEVKREDRLDQDCGADSGDRIDLSLELSEQLDVHIPDAVVEKICDAQTVGEVIDYVNQLPT